ncbi:MAG: hypothetical protein HQ561_05130, partial [Desulfobacteraceae bacterium]|nr:hypothetical protein [Desulfobacteraceae bacterium]
MKKNSEVRAHSQKAFLFLGCLVVPLLLLILACADDSEIAIVDFTKTVAVPTLQRPSPEHPHLRIAVAAMVSPKKTLSYYRQLLDYIGDNLDRKIQL